MAPMPSYTFSLGDTKMQIYYSDSAKSFFVSGIHEIIPEDKIEITKEEHSNLLKEININNKLIEIDSSGKIVLVEKPVDKELEKQKVIQTRNAMLAESDWTILPDAPFTKAQKDAWKEYRQALRDITKQEGFPENVVFPEKPA